MDDFSPDDTGPVQPVMVTAENLVGYRDFLLKVLSCLKEVPDPLKTFGFRWWVAVTTQHEQKDLLDAVLLSTAELPLFRPAEDVLPDFVFPTAHHAVVGIIERTEDVYLMFSDPDKVPEGAATIEEVMTHTSYHWPITTRDTSTEDEDKDWGEIMRVAKCTAFGRRVDRDSRIAWRFGEMAARIQKECAMTIKALSVSSPVIPQVEGNVAQQETLPVVPPDHVQLQKYSAHLPPATWQKLLGISSSEWGNRVNREHADYRKGPGGSRRSVSLEIESLPEHLRAHPMVLNGVQSPTKSHTNPH